MSCVEDDEFENPVPFSELPCYSSPHAPSWVAFTEFLRHFAVSLSYKAPALRKNGWAEVLGVLPRFAEVVARENKCCQIPSEQDIIGCFQVIDRLKSINSWKECEKWLETRSRKHLAAVPNGQHVDFRSFLSLRDYFIVNYELCKSASLQRLEQCSKQKGRPHPRKKEGVDVSFVLQSKGCERCVAEPTTSVPVEEYVFSGLDSGIQGRDECVSSDMDTPSEYQELERLAAGPYEPISRQSSVDDLSSSCSTSSSSSSSSGHTKRLRDIKFEFSVQAETDSRTVSMVSCDLPKWDSSDDDAPLNTDSFRGVVVRHVPNVHTDRNQRVLLRLTLPINTTWAWNEALDRAGRSLRVWDVGLIDFSMLQRYLVDSKAREWGLSSTVEIALQTALMLSLPYYVRLAIFGVQCTKFAVRRLVNSANFTCSTKVTMEKVPADTSSPIDLNVSTEAYKDVQRGGIPGPIIKPICQSVPCKVGSVLQGNCTTKMTKNACRADDNKRTALSPSEVFAPSSPTWKV